MYINPRDGSSKEKWLKDNAKGCSLHTFLNAPAGSVGVCLVDNGFFTAAAVAYDADEAKAFTSPSDPRPKHFFLVERGKLLDGDAGLAQWEIDKLREKV